MEHAINLEGFSELTSKEMLLVDGGGWTQAGAAFLGVVFMGAAPVVGVVAGIGASVVATPVVGVAAGVLAATGMVSMGANLLDYASK